jgi:hypothetical protein
MSRPAACSRACFVVGEKKENTSAGEEGGIRHLSSSPTIAPGAVCSEELSPRGVRLERRQGPRGKAAAAREAEGGLLLQKSRRRDSRAGDYGRYFLVLADRNALPGNQSFGLSLDDVERWLADWEAKARR